VSAQETFVIVGAGLAGAKAAEALRAQGFGGKVVLIVDEAERPYDRPPLSKGYLLGKSEREEIYVHPSGWSGLGDGPNGGTCGQDLEPDRGCPQHRAVFPRNLRGRMA
jgi:NADPH-dependent 2,4-dienoyl-CoA reductase/sulfur reductase-like enzyme